MRSDRKLKDSLINFRNAVEKLQRAIEIPKEQELVVEGTIQRFEVVVELLWKTLRRALYFENQPLRPDTPREVMLQGLRLGWLHNEVVWQELLDKRNTTSHEYLDESFIEQSYQEIINLTPEIVKILDFLESRYKS